MKKTVPVVFGFDESFTIPAGVCITSLLANALNTTTYEIHIISKDLKKESRDKFIRMVDACEGSHNIVFHDPGQAYIHDPTTVHFTTAMYYRFLIPDLLSDYEKAIYSDVDVVFLGDLSHLMDINLGENYLAAVTARYVVHLMETSLKKSNIDHLRDGYFASGFLVLNIQAMRKDRLVEMIDQLIRGNQYDYPDNDALNVACANKVKYLHLKYCVPPFVGDFLELEVNRYDEDRKIMLDESIESPVIIHYLGIHKPWRGHVSTMYENIWWEYYKKSVWYDGWYYFRNYLLQRARYRFRSARRKAKGKWIWR